MSALRTHQEGDCWSPCQYCIWEDEQAAAEEENDDE